MLKFDMDDKHYVPSTSSSAMILSAGASKLEGTNKMKYTKRRTQLYACIFALISAVLAITSTMSIGGIDILFASLGTAITSSTQAIIDLVNGINQTLPILGIDVESMTTPLEQVASGDISMMNRKKISHGHDPVNLC